VSAGVIKASTIPCIIDPDEFLDRWVSTELENLFDNSDKRIKKMAKMITGKRRLNLKAQWLIDDMAGAESLGVVAVGRAKEILAIK